MVRLCRAVPRPVGRGLRRLRFADLGRHAAGRPQRTEGRDYGGGARMRKGALTSARSRPTVRWSRASVVGRVRMSREGRDRPSPPAVGRLAPPSPSPSPAWSPPAPPTRPTVGRRGAPRRAVGHADDQRRRADVAKPTTTTAPTPTHRRRHRRRRRRPWHRPPPPEATPTTNVVQAPLQTTPTTEIVTGPPTPPPPLGRTAGRGELHPGLRPGVTTATRTSTPEQRRRRRPPSAVRSTSGDDPYGLDPDGDGVACTCADGARRQVGRRQAHRLVDPPSGGDRQRRISAWSAAPAGATHEHEQVGPGRDVVAGAGGALRLHDDEAGAGGRRRPHRRAAGARRRRRPSRARRSRAGRCRTRRAPTRRRRRRRR